MKVHLLTVGDELLIGQVVNTNASWLGEQLMVRGAEVVRMITVPDELDIIVSTLKQSREEADLVIITGGLGPTHDDLTREAIAEFLGVELEFHPEILATIEARFARRGKSMATRNRVQAMVPAGCVALDNPVGTAPGLWLQDGAFMLTALPGVPHEMKELMETHVFPRIQHHEQIRPLLQRTFLTTGIGESDLQEVLGETTQFLKAGQKLAYLPSIGGVRLRVTAVGESSEQAAVHLETVELYIRERLEDHIFGVESDMLEARVGEMLKDAELKLAVAESCTGGLIGDRITRVSGSSAYFVGGVIAYCNEVKRNVLGVDADVLAEHGAVSEQVAIQMAEGVRKLMNADIGISSTGIMGPSGGTPDKPVGTVWLAYVDDSTQWARCVSTQKDRQNNKLYASAAALSMLWQKLKTVEVGQ